MTEETRTLYICCKCFRTSAGPDVCHGEELTKVEVGPPGDASTKPLTDPQGRLITEAPRWWVEQVCRERFKERRR